MMKPILLAGAMALAAPAFAQVNANDGTMGQTKPGAAQEKAKKSAKPATGQQVTTSTEDSLTGTEGTTHSHAISSSTDGTTTDAKGKPEAEPTTVRQGAPGKVVMQESATKPKAEAETSGAMTSDSTDATGTTGTTGTTDTAATAATTATTGTTATAGTTATSDVSITTRSMTGVGGPAGDLMDVAGEVVGDSSRVQRVMRGSDSGMKASDLLNAAMLTLIQSGSATPK
jgi:cytoskeletal protein RodZ